MSTLGFYDDAPQKIENEGRELTVKLSKTGPSTARISWTLPKPAPGCTVDDLVYNGVVIVIDTKPITLDQTPVSGKYYTADAVADTNLHAGDRLGTGLVVGAFYNDKATTFIDIANVEDRKSYYVAAFAVDNVANYCREGVHSYSLPYGLEAGKDTAGYQIVRLGVNSTDATPLSGTQTYNFEIFIDGNQNYIQVPGGKAATYGDLISYLNNTLAVINNPYQSPYPPNANAYFYDAINSRLYQWNGYQNVLLSPTVATEAPATPNAGDYWFNPSSTQLSQWNGTAWVTLIYSMTVLTPANGTVWYNPQTQVTQQWNNGWIQIAPPAYVALNPDNNLVFTSGTLGSTSSIILLDGSSLGLFANLNTSLTTFDPVKGTDGVSAYPMYNDQDIGTDGSADARREMVETILIQLGYPTVQVELTKEQLEFCVDQGLQTLRKQSSAGYERVFFFLQLKAGQQRYILTDKTVGFNKIVNVMSVNRTSSAFLNSASGDAAFGQMLLQQLYTQGTFDLVTYHAMGEYVGLMEKLFATHMMYQFNERRRTLDIMSRIGMDEKVLIDCSIERTEKDILADRYLNNWVQDWATGEAKLILAQIRGKYGSLPGAGGGVSLNAEALRTEAQQLFDDCLKELDNFLVNNIEDFGMGSDFIIG